MVSSKAKNKTINIGKKLRESELGRIRYNSMMRHRVLLNAIFDIVIAVLLFLSLLLIIFKYSPVNLVSMPAVCAVVMMGLSITIITYDIKSVDRNSSDFSVKPDWYNIVEMLFYSLGIYLALSFIVLQVIPEGIGIYHTTGLPGGIVICLFVPAAVLLAYNFASVKIAFSIFDAFVVTELMLALHIVSYTCVNLIGLTGPVYDCFCTLKSFLLNIVLVAASALLLYVLNLMNVKVSNMNKSRIISSGWKYNSHQMSLAGVILSNQRLRHSVYLLMNLAILVISVRTIMGSVGIWAELGLLSVPALMSLTLVIVSVLSIPMNITGIKLASSNVYYNWYKYCSFLRCVAVAVNLNTAMVDIVVNGGTVMDIFRSRMGGDGYTYVLCPVLAVIFILMEANEYSLKDTVLCSLPCSVLMFLSLYIINKLDALSLIQGNIAVFFKGAFFYTTVLSPFAEGALVYVLSFINANDEKYKAESIVVEREKGQEITFSVCGARDDIAPTSPKYYEFGQASNCFVLRDGSYGLVMDCGSGLVYAPEKLQGCSNVDIILTNTNFSTVMGLLAVPNPCPKAKVRIFGPFGNGRNFVNMNGFATPPLWPVNVIVGECISVKPDTDVPLNNLYSFRFISAEEQSTHYMIRISGAASIAYTGAIKNSNENNMSWAEGCDLLIYNDKLGAETACGIADDIGAGYLLLANHDSFANDDTLNSYEHKTRSIFASSDYARQGSEYNMI